MADRVAISFHAAIAEIPAAEWDALANPDGGPPPDPFVLHRFLDALERSGSVGPGTGWTPQHLALRAEGRLIGAAPLYLKSHSQGEYVFDHGWAEAWQRAGGRYYPKLQGAVPFTPVPGRRLLGGPEARATLLRAIAEVTAGNGLSSAHITFCAPEEATGAEEAGWLVRRGQQYHWQNRGYGSFGDFLGDLSARKRKMIRKERETAQGFGGTIRAVTGDDIRPSDWAAMWAFYQDTGARKWGRPYLTRAFFDALHDMRDAILLVLAERDGRQVAGALNFIGREALFGRYWGAVEDHPCLHFECCYYQAIDFAIAQGLARVEAGAQGEHKIARGYLPVETLSVHWIDHPGFRDAVARFLAEERAALSEEMEILTSYGPFRKGSIPEND